MIESKQGEEAESGDHGMDGMLSQGEIDALLAQTAAAAGVSRMPVAAGGVGSVAATPDVKRYDFKRPEKFSREQLRGLERIHERFARLLSTSLSAYIRTNIIVRIESVTPLSYQDFVFSLPQPTLIHVIEFVPLEGQAALEMNPTVVFPLFEQMMGGQQRGTTRIRPLTDVELVLFQRPLDRILQCLAETWQDFVRIHPRLVRAEQDPQFAQVAAVNTPVVVVSLEVTIGEEFGMMSLCMPDVLVDALLHHLGQERLASPRGSEDRDRQRVREALGDVPLPVIAELGCSRLTVRQIRELAVGDVIRLDTPAGGEVRVHVRDQALYRGRVGQLRRNLAVRITASEEPPVGLDGVVREAAAEAAARETAGERGLEG